jgi:hypothetical protein
MFAVLPFGNRTVILTLTGAQLEQAFLNGFSPACNSAIRGHGPLPAGVGAAGDVHLQRHDAGRDRHVEDARGHGRAGDPIGPADTVRLVTNDFMYTGGDGYTSSCRGRTSCSRRRSAGAGRLAFTYRHRLVGVPPAGDPEGLAGGTPHSLTLCSRSWSWIAPTTCRRAAYQALLKFSASPRLPSVVTPSRLLHALPLEFLILGRER